MPILYTLAIETQGSRQRAKRSDATVPKRPSHINHMLDAIIAVLYDYYVNEVLIKSDNNRTASNKVSSVMRRDDN